jgi:hypothetical protein
MDVTPQTDANTNKKVELFFVSALIIKRGLETALFPNLDIGVTY